MAFTTRTTALASVLALGLAGVAGAQSAESDPGTNASGSVGGGNTVTQGNTGQSADVGGAAGTMAEAMNGGMSAFDENGDGEVSRDEYESGFDRMDANGDGTLSDGEMERFSADETRSEDPSTQETTTMTQ